MTSEILIRRYDKIFRIYDSNGNGYVEQADFTRVQGQFLAIVGESPASPRGGNVTKLWDDYWQALLSTVAHATDGQISLQEWRDGMARLADDQAGYQKVFTPLASAVFSLLDSDGDDKVVPAEWRSFQESLGNAAAADVSFQHMDTNHNGYLTVEELIEGVHEYLTNPDPDVRGGGILGDV